MTNEQKQADVLLPEFVIQNFLDLCRNGNSCDCLDGAYGCVFCDRRVEAETALDKMKEREKALQAKLDEAVDGIKQTLEENAHLADGDVCTLYKLKQTLQRLTGRG